MQVTDQPTGSAAHSQVCQHHLCRTTTAVSGKREWEQGDFCETHRRDIRRRLGVCPRCAAELEREPEINMLTGRQLIRAGEPVSQLVCVEDCGYTQRSKPTRTRR